MSLLYGEERLRYVADQITGMFTGQISPSQLGTLALEVLIAKGTAEEILRGDSSKEEKEKARKTLDELKEMEKNIVRIYMLSKIEHTQRRKPSVFDYMLSKYTVPRKE